MSATARIAEPGSSYFDQRTGRIVRLSVNHAAVVCEACEYVVHLPTKYGRDYHEEVRRRHLTTAHLSGLISGRVVLTPTDQPDVADILRRHITQADTGAGAPPRTSAA